MKFEHLKGSREVGAKRWGLQALRGSGVHVGGF